MNNMSDSATKKRDELKKQAWVKAGEFATYPNFVTSHDVAEFMFKEGFNSGYAVGLDEGKNDAIIEYKNISTANQYKFISLENTDSCAEDMRDKAEAKMKIAVDGLSCIEKNSKCLMGGNPCWCPGCYANNILSQINKGEL